VSKEVTRSSYKKRTKENLEFALLQWAGFGWMRNQEQKEEERRCNRARRSKQHTMDFKVEISKFER